MRNMSRDTSFQLFNGTISEKHLIKLTCKNNPLAVCLHFKRFSNMWRYKIDAREQK